MVKIPNRLEDLYPASVIEKFMDVLQQPDLPGKVKETLGKVGLGELNPLEQAQQAWQQARSWIESVASDSGRPRDSEVINATGTFLHADLANPPMSSSVAQVQVRGGSRYQHRERVEKRIAQATQSIFDGQTCCLAASCHAALNAIVAKHTVLIAKTDLVRIAGVGSLDAMLASHEVIEVGPANGCTLQDWENVLEREDGKDVLILAVSPNTLNNEEANRQLDGAKAAAKSKGVPIIGFMADATLNSKLAESLGVTLLQKELGSDFDAVVAPLHLLIGGPFGACIIGSEALVSQAKKRLVAVGADLASSAQIAAAVALQSAALEQESDSGGLHYLDANPETLKERARRIAIQCNDNSIVKTAEEISTRASLGASPWSKFTFDSWAVAMETVEPIATVLERLLQGEVDSEGPIIPAIAAITSDGRLIIDLRFVDPEDDHLIVLALSPAPPVEDESSESAATDTE